MEANQLFLNRVINVTAQVRRTECAQSSALQSFTPSLAVAGVSERLALVGRGFLRHRLAENFKRRPRLVGNVWQHRNVCCLEIAARVTLPQAFFSFPRAW
jgi:hypothetical protein